MNPALSLLLLLAFATSAAASIPASTSALPSSDVPVPSADAPSVSATEEEPDPCEDDLVKVSPCLPHITAPPNKATPAPSSACCQAVSTLRQVACLCYVVRDSLLLGFPINSTRAAALFDTCSNSGGDIPHSIALNAGTFSNNCRELQALSPFLGPSKGENHASSPPSRFGNPSNGETNAPSPKLSHSHARQNPNSSFVNKPWLIAQSGPTAPSPSNSAVPVQGANFCSLRSLLQLVGIVYFFSLGH